MLRQHIHSIQNVKTMNELKEIVVNTLISNGLSERIRLEDRKHQLGVAEKASVILWLVFSGLAFGSLRLLWIPVLALVFAFVIEQVVDLVLGWRQAGGQHRFPWAYIQDRLFSRSIYKRMNLTLALVLLVFYLIVLSFRLDSLYLGWFQFSIVSIGLMSSAVLENTFRRPGREALLFIGVRLLRAISQMKSIFGMVLPGIILSFLVVSVSDAIWQLIDGLSWARIALLLFVLFLFACFRSGSTLERTLRNQFQTIEFEKDPFSAHRLYKAVMGCTPWAQTKKMPAGPFHAFCESYSWKWRPSLTEAARRALLDELNARKGWQVWLSLLILFPLLFFLMTGVAAILFSPVTISHWLNDRPVEFSIISLIQSVFLNAPLDSAQLFELLRRDPLLKYSALASGFLTVNFLLEYVQDGKRLLSNLQTSEKLLNEWFVLLCAYHALDEYEYQQIAFSWMPVGRFIKGSLTVPIVLLPNEIDDNLMERVVNRLQIREVYRYPYIFMMKAQDFLKFTPDAFQFGGETNDVISDMIRGQNSPVPCWLWLEKKTGETALHEFEDIGKARQWALRRSGEVELKPSGREKSFLS